MLLIAAFAIYVIVVKRVHITRNFMLTGTNARNFGIALLILLLPMVLVVNVTLAAILPASILANPVVSRVSAVVLLGLLAVGLAAIFRDKSAPPATTGNP